MLPRKIYPELLKHASKPTNTVLTGMRRTGKTTLIKQLLIDLKSKNSIFLDLERLDNREIFLQKNYDGILLSLEKRGLSRKLPMIVALDEIQNVPGVPSVIKYLSDHYKIKFIVTGSSSYYLKNLFSESLSGRKKIFELYPLDFGEYLTFKGERVGISQWEKGNFEKVEYARLRGFYEDYIVYGGFPQVVLAENEQEKKDHLADIMSSYVNIDIRTLADFTNERNIYSLITLLAGRVGSRVDISKLSSLVGLSRPTVTNYLDFLEKTYLIATVPVYTNSVDREIVKARKVYFRDTGIANYLADLSGGAQFENALFNQLDRLGRVQYYALKNGIEMDFVFEGRVGIEAKETPIQSDTLQLTKLAKLAGLQRGILVGRHEGKKFDDYVWGGSIW